MKKSLTGMLALLAGAVVVHAQGTISLQNYTTGTYVYVSYAGHKLGGNTGPTATMGNYALETGNGADWTVQLYGAVGSGLSSSQLAALPGMTSTFELNNLSDSFAGTWYSTSSFAFSSAPQGTIATVQLYAWYNAGGQITDYATAVADGVPAGSSAPANVSLSAPPNAPSTLPAAGLGSFTLAPVTIPEPSTIALGMVGASAFLMRLRRKK